MLSKKLLKHLNHLSTGKYRSWMSRIGYIEIARVNLCTFLWTAVALVKHCHVYADFPSVNLCNQPHRFHLYVLCCQCLRLGSDLTSSHLL